MAYGEWAVLSDFAPLTECISSTAFSGLMENEYSELNVNSLYELIALFLTIFLPSSPVMAAMSFLGMASVSANIRKHKSTPNF
jgi:hypothetical protein